MDNEKNEVDIDQEAATELPERDALSVVGPTVLGGVAAGTALPDPAELTTGQGIEETTPPS